MLLARRLIEAGTRLVTVSWAPDANATWDTHGGNFKKLKRTLLPQLDAACGSLLDDLADRGRLSRTLVAVMGDFGRTPKINANAGRDHWNFCYSLAIFGGGFREGLVYGESDATGAYPNGNPVSPADLITTLYHARRSSGGDVTVRLPRSPARARPAGARDAGVAGVTACLDAPAASARTKGAGVTAPRACGCWGRSVCETIGGSGTAPMR